MRTQAGWIEGAIAAAGELGEWALEAGASRIGESCVDEVLSRLRGQQPPAPGVGKAGGTGSTGPPSAAPLTAAARARQAVADARLAEASAELAAVNAGQTAAHMQQAIAYAEEQARLRAEYDRLRAEDASLRLLRLRYLGYRGQGEGTPETISPGAQTALVLEGALPFVACMPRYCPVSAWWAFTSRPAHGRTAQQGHMSAPFLPCSKNPPCCRHLCSTDAGGSKAGISAR